MRTMMLMQRLEDQMSERARSTDVGCKLLVGYVHEEELCSEDCANGILEALFTEGVSVLQKLEG